MSSKLGDHASFHPFLFPLHMTAYTRARPHGRAQCAHTNMSSFTYLEMKAVRNWFEWVRKRRKTRVEFDQKSATSLIGPSARENSRRHVIGWGPHPGIARRDAAGAVVAVVGNFGIVVAAVVADATCKVDIVGLNRRRF